MGVADRLEGDVVPGDFRLRRCRRFLRRWRFRHRVFAFPEHLDETRNGLAGLQRPFDLDQSAFYRAIAEDLGLLSEKDDAGPLGRLAASGRTNRSDRRERDSRLQHVSVRRSKPARCCECKSRTVKG